MALDIGSNFNLNSRQFLDERMGLAKTLQDLKTWNVSVPEGFEVVVGHIWYVYDSSYTDETTGHWRKRVDSEYDGSIVQEKITKILSDISPLYFSSFSGGGEFEAGNSIIPTLTWEVSRKLGEEISVQQVKSVKINDIEQTSKNEYTSPTSIMRSTSYKVDIVAGDDNLSASKTVSYNFYCKKFWGTSSSETFDSSMLSGFSSTFTKTWKLDTTLFDCTGGKYLYYVIPSDYYNEDNFRMWINGFQNSDYTIYTEIITNSFGYSCEYKIIKLNNKQTGKLTVKFE